MTRLFLLALLLVAVPAVGFAQTSDETDENGQPLTPERREARRLYAEADALTAAEQWARAADAWMRLHDYMEAHDFPRAVVGYHNVCLALSHLPGRESDAIDACRRFLDGSNSPTLTEDAQIRDFRSGALERIAELEARIGADTEPAEGEAVGEDAAPSARSGGGTSPVGPIVLGIGIVAVLAGIITGAVALVDGDALRADCGGSMCPPSEQDRVSSVTGLSNATDALLIGGGVVAVTGLILTFVLRDGGGEAPQAAIACDSTGCAASVRGAF